MNNESQPHQEATDTRLIDGETYHVVCHHCGFEGLTDDEGEAEQATEQHRLDTHHHVEYQQIATDGEATVTDGGALTQRQQRQAEKLQLQHAAEQGREQRLQTALKTGQVEKQGQRIWIIPEFQPDEAEAEYIKESVREALPEYDCQLVVDSTKPMTKDRIHDMLLRSGEENGEPRTDGGSKLRCASCRATVTLDDTLELQAPEIGDGTIARVRICEDCRPDTGNKRPVTAYKDLLKAVIKRANGIDEEQATLADSEIMPDGGETVADAGEADARASERLPSVGECRFPSGRGHCGGQHVLDPDSLLEDGFIRFPCRREGCDAETVMPRGVGIERLDEAGFDVAALARRGDTQLGSVWLGCPDCGARGSILAEGDLECQECDETFDPEEVW
jgi:predicted RNA-binding Zn-ribbon protein involved in translation (DUF1610 family)